MRRLSLFVRSIIHRTRVDEELDEEFQYHLEREMEELLKHGLSPNEARDAARRRMGAITQNREQCRDARGVNFIDDFFLDMKYAGRNLRRSPGFTVVAVFTMCLGIGANSAVFNVINSVVLRPLQYRDPDRIVVLGTRETARGNSDFQHVSIPNFQDWRLRSSSFAAMAYYGSREVPVIANEAAEYARGTEVSSEFLQVFAVEPLLGRLFSPEKQEPNSGGAALISYTFWQSHFGGDPSVLSRTIRVYGTPYPVAGVLPPGFSFPDKTDVWVPAHLSLNDQKYRSAQNWQAIARLKPGVSLQRAQAELATIAGRLAQQYPESNSGRSVAVARLQDHMTTDIRLTLYLLLGAVSLVLLIACANTATLLLGKATARTREIAVRAALGATRQRIVRQLITESSLLSATASGAGLLLAYGASKAMMSLAPADVPRLAETSVDSLVLAFTAGSSIVTSILFGVAPALYASKVELNGALKQGGTKLIAAGGMARTRRVLVSAEIALAVLLLCSAGLLIKSFLALNHVALGFRPENVLIARASVPGPLESTAPRAFFNSLLPRIANLSGVMAAGATMAPPGGIESSGAYFIDHMPAQLDVRNAPEAILSVIAPGTFAALGIPVKAGRDFSTGDTSDRPLVAIVNEALVREAFAHQDPVGRTIFCTYDNFRPMTIVGVVGDVRQRGPAEASKPECYMPYRQHAFNGNALSIVIRTTNDPTALEQTVSRFAKETSSEVPVSFTTMDARLAQNVAGPRFRTLLFGIFAAIAISLAMVGIYGVMAYAVSQRSSEIGLRIALGASTNSVLRLVVGQGLTLAAAGLAMGLAAALAMSRLLTATLFEVKPNDPIVYLSVVILLGAAALIASYIPARRASKIDPLTAIRQE